MVRWRGLIERYSDRLPVTDATPVVTLNEGSTPLLPAPALSERTGCDVYLKVEGANPTGSFKDRGMTMAVSKAVGFDASSQYAAAMAADNLVGSPYLLVLVMIPALALRPAQIVRTGQRMNFNVS